MLAPAVATFTLQLTDNAVYIAVYMAAVCVLSFVAIYAGAEAYQRYIEEAAGERLPAPGSQPTC
ncbi:MAG: hypothetical protein M3315_04250 [Actinomycetota bacterium]|nr:hypothetical protein [Actinomycetota bacterium]